MFILYPFTLSFVLSSSSLCISLCVLVCLSQPLSVPVWQLVPVHPGRQSQVYLLGPSMHSPLFKHGSDLHSSTSEKENHMARPCRTCRNEGFIGNITVVYT